MKMRTLLVRSNARRERLMSKRMQKLAREHNISATSLALLHLTSEMVKYKNLTWASISELRVDGDSLIVGFADNDSMIDRIQLRRRQRGWSTFVMKNVSKVISCLYPAGLPDATAYQTSSLLGRPSQHGAMRIPVKIGSFGS